MENQTRKTWTVDDLDLVHASWDIAALIEGEDDGTGRRDELERQIQNLLVGAFEPSDTLWPRDPGEQSAMHQAGVLRGRIRAAGGIPNGEVPRARTRPASSVSG